MNNAAEKTGGIIRKARKRAGLNQVQLANKMGIVQSFLSELENEEKPLTWQTAVSLQKHLGIPLGVLAGHPPGLLEQKPNRPATDTHVKIPLVTGKIAAGAGFAANDSLDDWAWLHKDQLKGRIGHNLVRVDPDEIVLKRLAVIDHIMVLISANPDVRAFPPRRIDLRKSPEPVIGKVVWKWEECP